MVNGRHIKGGHILACPLFINKYLCIEVENMNLQTLQIFDCSGEIQNLKENIHAAVIVTKTLNINDIIKIDKRLSQIRRPSKNSIVARFDESENFALLTSSIVIFPGITRNFPSVFLVDFALKVLIYIVFS